MLLFNSGDEDEDEAPEEEKVKDDRIISPAIYGSRAANYGGGHDLIADQFNLYTLQQKHNQIVLIQVFIYMSTVLLFPLPKNAIFKLFRAPENNQKQLIKDTFIHCEFSICLFISVFLMCWCIFLMTF